MASPAQGNYLRRKKESPAGSLPTLRDTVTWELGSLKAEGRKNMTKMALIIETLKEHLCTDNQRQKMHFLMWMSRVGLKRAFSYPQ